MQSIHPSFQQAIANFKLDSKNVLDYANFQMLILYLNIIPVRVPIKGDLGAKILNSLKDEECMNNEQRLQSVVEIMKLVSVRPDLDGLVYGLELDQIYAFEELVKIVEDN